MSGLLSSRFLRGRFFKAESVETSTKVIEAKSALSKPKKKRLPPLSIRLNAEERAQLERDAAGMPLSTYAKQRTFRASSRKAACVEDKQALARILSLLGQTGLIEDLRRLVSQIEAGKVRLGRHDHNKIRRACDAALLMRRDLIMALGLKQES